MILYPNAKINLGLNIIKKRNDGYHEISSIFYPVSQIYDILEIIPSSIFNFSSSGIPIPGKKEDNLCVRAYKLLKSEFNIGCVKIHLHKQIPIGGGLGGGSSNGSLTLIALNNIFNLNLSTEQLEKYALKLGADCPFFIQNKPKYVTGIGDTMTSINLDLSRFTFKFNFSSIHINTKEAYDEIIPKNTRLNLVSLIKNPVNLWKENLHNDFEDLIFSKYPKLEKIKNKFYDDGADYVSMSGSGCVIYALYSKKK